MSSSLKTLKIEHLRGSVVPFTVAFGKGKNLTIIYGENGTGKTTICDAIEFLSDGKIGSLEDRGLGAKLHQYWPSLGKKASDVSVTLETSESVCTARIVNGKAIAEPNEKRPIVEIFRRSQIVSLLEAKAADRYAVIRKFVDVSGPEASEDALRKLIKSMKGSREIAVARVQENFNAVEHFWETAGKLGKDALSWARQEIKLDITNIEQQAKSCRLLQQSYQALAAYPGKFAAAENARVTAQTAVSEAEAQLNVVLGGAAEGAGELIEILQAAKSYLENHVAPTVCPLCESEDNVLGLREAVDGRITQFRDLMAAKQRKDSSTQTLQKSEADIIRLKGELAQDIAAFEGARSDPTLGTDFQFPDSKMTLDYDHIGSWLDESKILTEKWSKQEAEWQAQCRHLETLKKNLQTYDDNEAEQKKLDVLLPNLDRALEIIVQQRIDFTDQVLKKIANEVGRIYERVHPGEGLDKISLMLDPDKRASLEIGSSFGTETDTPPQAYFSQSHLDTLGLCMFLALASLDNPGNKILLLDDVLGSVDEPHVDRLIDMVYTEVNKFQHCIITTHYGPWRQKLKWGWLKNGQCHFIELTKWSLDGGMKTIQHIPEIDRLRNLLNDPVPDLQSICAKSGVILEAAFDFLTQLYECPMPRRRDPRYTLGEYLLSIDKKLRSALRIEVASNDSVGTMTYLPVSLTPMLEELSRISQTRNLFGAHFNGLSFEMLDSDALSFGQQTLKLIETLVDAENGWPRNGKSGSYWETYGDTRRLHPLRKPA